MHYIKRDPNDLKIIAASEVQFDPDFEYSEENYELGFDGKLYSESEMLSEQYLAQEQVYLEELSKNDVRIQRNIAFNKYIDKSVLWYESLTDEQKRELKIWYETWKDAPKTGIIPQPLSWFK